MLLSHKIQQTLLGCSRYPLLNRMEAFDLQGSLAALSFYCLQEHIFPLQLTTDTCIYVLLHPVERICRHPNSVHSKQNKLLVRMHVLKFKNREK